jgi:hypothetical protein
MGFYEILHFTSIFFWVEFLAVEPSSSPFGFGRK